MRRRGSVPEAGGMDGGSACGSCGEARLAGRWRRAMLVGGEEEKAAVTSFNSELI